MGTLVGMGRVIGAIGCVTTMYAAVTAQQPRDSVGPDVVGDATIAGVVVSADGATAPIRRVVVTASGSALTRARSAITDDEGRFEIGGLPEGRFLVTARKPAYLDMTYGAKRPGRPGTPVPTSAGERTDVTIALTGGGVIAGVVRDERGAPVPGAAVRGIDARGADDSRIFGEAEGVTTDDRGMYRLYGLPPGEYLVVTTPRLIGNGTMGRPTAADMDALLRRLGERGRARRPGQNDAGVPLQPRPVAVTLAPTYYPGTALVEDARRVAIGPAEIRENVDVALSATPAVNISGVITDSGVPLGAGVQLSITREGEHRSLTRGSAGSRPILSQPPGEDGRFTFTNVPPGRYTIVARSRRTNGLPAPAPAGAGRSGTVGGGGGSLTVSGPGGGPALPPGEGYFFARAQARVDGADIEGLALALRPGVTVAGRVTFEGTSEPPFDSTDLVIRIRAAAGSFMSMSNNTLMGNPFSSVGPAPVGPDGTFAAANVGPDTYTLAAAPPTETAGGWWLRSAEAGGRDLLDAPFGIGDTDITGIVLTYTDHQTELTGRLQTAAGVAAPDHFVVVVPADRTRWVPGSRRMQSVRPDTGGRFSVMHLPAGDYLLAALTDFEPADLADTSFLDQLAAVGVPVTIRDGAQTVQDLQIAEQ